MGGNASILGTDWRLCADLCRGGSVSAGGPPQRAASVRGVPVAGSGGPVRAGSPPVVVSGGGVESLGGELEVGLGLGLRLGLG